MKTKPLTLVGILALTILGCGQPASQSTIGPILRRGLGGEPSTLDPALAADTFSLEVLRDLYEGLTSENAAGEVFPAIASSWTVDESGKQYTFQLRPNALWSNGTPIRAKDFVVAWRRVVDPKEGSPVADDLRIISGAASIMNGAAPSSTLGVFAVSDSVLRVTLEHPAPYLPQLLTHSAAYPINSDAPLNGRNASRWTSDGPYVLSSWSPGTVVTLTKNPLYWDRANVRITGVQYQIADERSQYARYRAGQLDMTDTVPANAITSLRENHPSELVIAPFMATAYYGLNLSNQPLADNQKLRQAIAMAIDRKQLVSSLAFGQLAAYGFTPPGTWNYSPQSFPWKELSDGERKAEAKRLYSEAGYSSANPLKLRLLFNSDPVIKNTAVIIADMWKETLGIQTLLTEEEYRVFLQSRHDKTRWEIARLGWTADYNDASNFLDVFREHSNNNDEGYSNHSFDLLLDKAAGTADPQRRREFLEEAEKLMLADYPIAPLYFYVSKRLVKPNLHGIKSNPLNRVTSKTLEFSSQ
jgi:oligopeptide transport system substrate-binding protein